MFEGCAIFIAVFYASAVYDASNSIFFDFYLFLKTLLITFVCQTTLYYNDLYDFKIASTLLKISIRLFHVLGISAIILAVIYIIFPSARIDQEIFVSSMVCLLFFITAWRVLYVYILSRGMFNENIVILGSSGLALDIFHEIDGKIDCGYTVVAAIPELNDSRSHNILSSNGLEWMPKKGLCDAVLNIGVKKIVVALKESRGIFPTEELLKCRVAGLDVIDGNTFYETLTGKLPVTSINPSWLIFSDGFKKSLAKTALKRIMDIVASFALMLLFSPLFLLISIVIKLESKGPVLFVQDRVGQLKKEYLIYKFRSMVDDAEQLSGPVWTKDGDDRITRVGKIIRKFRIDELPQLWNVFIGNMSIVGPRPERKFFTDELEKKIPYYSERFAVKPGITGWAQVSFDYGASENDAIEKLNFELFYIKNMSFLFDCVIVLRTMKTVFLGEGAR